jgi:CarD family transcriptional regulator
MRLAVGDAVVYGAHGAGTVAARETRLVLGKRQVIVVLALSGGLSVELPLARAEELLRPVADESELRRVQEVLSAATVPSSESWHKRQQEARAKLGSTLGLAEIVREGTSQEVAGRPRSQLSPTESALLARARELLATEIALSRGIEQAAASRWIDAQLSSLTP